LKKPLVSVISVNFNQEGHTIDFLSSIYSSRYENIEVVIVDNGSKVPLDKNLEDRFANLRIIHSKENLGFAGGNNLGTKEAKGDYLFFLNNDTIVVEGFFESLVDFLRDNQKIGIVSPKIIFNNKHIQYAGSLPINPFTGRGRALGSRERDDGKYDRIYETAYAHGAAMATSREVLKQVGLMDEEYFLYYEELDWTERIKKAGYQAYYYGKTYIIHKESMSVGKESPLKTYYMNRNRLLFQRKNVSSFKLFISVAFFLLVSLPKSSLQFLIARKNNHLTSLWRGVLWHVNKKYVYKG